MPVMARGNPWVQPPRACGYVTRKTEAPALSHFKTSREVFPLDKTGDYRGGLVGGDEFRRRNIQKSCKALKRFGRKPAKFFLAEKLSTKLDIRVDRKSVTGIRMPAFHSTEESCPGAVMTSAGRGGSLFIAPPKGGNTRVSARFGDFLPFIFLTSLSTFLQRFAGLGSVKQLVVAAGGVGFPSFATT
jgi:hypothetical protein